MIIAKNKILTFSSKARTLEALSKTITTAKVLPIFLFSVSDYKKSPKFVITEIQRKFDDGFLIIRSSSSNEDGVDVSHAGHYQSILNVPQNDPLKIKEAIDKVIAAYKNSAGNNEVFIQPQLEHIKLSGVVFTADLDCLTPYYTINYIESDKSDIITGGKSGNLKTFIYYKKSLIKNCDKNLKHLIKVCKKLEKLFNYPYLDIEFAYDNKNILYIFQVRPIVSRSKENLSQIRLSKSLKNIHKKILKLSSPHPNLLGSKTLFGIMPDWNPAEIIGHKPKQLSTSLYREFITDNIWAYQRDNYGYRNLRSHPLMVTLLGIPYIDVRVDFNSFIPKGLDENISKKLVEYYLDKLVDKPHLHDKIEFEIVHSCLYLNLPDKLKELQNYGFNKKEINKIITSLRKLTINIINPQRGLYKKDLQKIEVLKSKYESIISSELPLVDKIYWLIEDCKRYGTLPFAGIARAAFIATQILKSLIDLQVISQNEYNLFTNSLNTVAKKINNDLFKLSKGKMTVVKFLELYGHLRPGTYDISSLRYDENFSNYFSLQKVTPLDNRAFSFSREQKNQIDMLLRKNCLEATADELVHFIKESIEGREYAKYIFTRSLSKILQLIEEIGKRCMINRNDLAFVDIKTIINFYSSLDYRDMRQVLRWDINKHKRSHTYTKAVKLPSLIINPEDIYGFSLSNDEPNFITLKRISSKTSQEELFATDKLDGKIVFIKSADPGYDFLFTKNIGGLITQFGGANSHMAIRCAELGIPAVIGCGDRNFNHWIKAKILEVDCSNKQVKIIS